MEKFHIMQEIIELFSYFFKKNSIKFINDYKSIK